jgi:poly-beta-1,6-N-acetyl-D-glucosamine synthase
MTVIGLIPAHNEEGDIAMAIRHVRDQVDVVVVVDDRSTDQTQAVARAEGAKVFPIVANEHKKAGALNQALAKLLPVMADDAFVLVQDADSFVEPDFVANARGHIEKKDLGACGGVFLGRGGGGLVGWCQRNEFARYARDVKRNRGKTLCLTGTATLFRVDCLREVAASRESGTVYDTTALTEDFELTLKLRHLGHEAMAPRDCALTTDIMPTWKQLIRQRYRWKRGAVEALARYGLTRITWGHWARQTWGWIGVAATGFFVLTLGYGLVVGLSFQPFWLGITGVFMVEKAVTTRSRGWGTTIAATFLLFEMAYDIALQVMHVRAWWGAIFHRKSEW